MNQQPSESFGNNQNASAFVGSVPHDSEENRDLPNDSESFGSVPNASEAVGKFPNDAEGFRTEPFDRSNHTLTTREAARQFEDQGVARTERSIINWCKPNKQGIARLDCFFDPNEGKYFITQESVDLAIKELQSQVQRQQGNTEKSPTESHRSDSDTAQDTSAPSQQLAEDRETRNRLRDLEVTNMVKDQFIERLETDRDKLLDQVIASNHKIGVLETQLLQLQSPDRPILERPPVAEPVEKRIQTEGDYRESTAPQAPNDSTEYNSSHVEERA